MLDFHNAREAEATVLVTKVDDPSKYGVVVMDEYGQIQRFVEKPKVRAGVGPCKSRCFVDMLAHLRKYPTHCRD